MTFNILFFDVFLHIFLPKFALSSNMVDWGLFGHPLLFIGSRYLQINQFSFGLKKSIHPVLNIPERKCFIQISFGVFWLKY